MAKTIFRVLKSCSRDVEVANSVVYKKLVELLEQGGITNSEVDQFISKNYLLSVEDLTKKWNMTHTKQKIEMTFRGQISTLSCKYYKLFGMNANTLEEALLSKDNNHPVVGRLLKILTAIGVESEPLVSRFHYGIKDYLGDYQTNHAYNVSDCEKELRLLKMMDKKNLELIFSQVDKDKLAYIFQTMNADLIQSEVTDFERLDKHTRQVIKNKDGSAAVRRVISPVVNEMKMELCLRFNDTKAMKLSVAKQVDSAKVISNTSGVGSESTTIHKSAEPKANNPYGLNITKEMLDMIIKKANEKANVFEMFSDKNKDNYKKYLKSLDVNYSVASLRAWLNKVVIIDLYSALLELKDMDTKRRV